MGRIIYPIFMTWKIIHSCKFTHQPVFVGLYVISTINHRIHPHFRFNQWMILWMIFPLHMGFSSDKRWHWSEKIQRLQTPLTIVISTINHYESTFPKKSRAYKRKEWFSSPLRSQWPLGVLPSMIATQLLVVPEKKRGPAWDGNRETNCGAPRPGKHKKSYWKLPFIVSFPMKNGDFQKVFCMFTRGYPIFMGFNCFKPPFAAANFLPSTDPLSLSTTLW